MVLNAQQSLGQNHAQVVFIVNKGVCGNDGDRLSLKRRWDVYLGSLAEIGPNRIAVAVFIELEHAPLLVSRMPAHLVKQEIMHGLARLTA